MHDFALSAANHDLIFKDGDLVLISDAERVAQQIKIKLKSFLGEWFLDTTYGVPYWEDILIKNPSLDHIRNILRQQILDVDDVFAVTALSLTLNNQSRTLTVDFVAETTYGLVTAKEVLGYGDE
jgi:hypothetical protein